MCTYKAIAVAMIFLLSVSVTSGGAAETNAVFEKSKGERIVCYEVVIIQCLPSREVFGKSVLAHEAMPPSASWCYKGWSYVDETSARRKLRELIFRKDASHSRCIRQIRSPIAADSTADLIEARAA